MKGACQSCKWARTKISSKNKLTGEKFISYKGSGLGYCGKDTSVSFMPREIPDYSLPVNECWEPKEEETKPC